MSEVLEELADAIKEVGLPNPEVLEPFHAKWEKYRIEGMATEPMEWRPQKLNDFGLVDCYKICLSATEAANVIQSWMDEETLRQQIEDAGLPDYCRLDEPEPAGKLVARWTALEYEIREVEVDGSRWFNCDRTEPGRWSNRRASTLDEALHVMREMMDEFPEVAK